MEVDTRWLSIGILFCDGLLGIALGGGVLDVDDLMMML